MLCFDKYVYIRRARKLHRLSSTFYQDFYKVICMCAGINPKVWKNCLNTQQKVHKTTFCSHNFSLPIAYLSNELFFIIIYPFLFYFLLYFIHTSFHPFVVFISTFDWLFSYWLNSPSHLSNFISFIYLLFFNLASALEASIFKLKKKNEFFWNELSCLPFITMVTIMPFNISTDL